MPTITQSAPLEFEERYDLRDRLWTDGPHAGWRAFDRVLEREVVVNMPYEGFTKVDHFIEAAKFRARHRHANLVPVFDFGITHQGSPFFTEPYLETFDLGRLRRDRQDVGSEQVFFEQLRFLIEACEPLAFLNGNGLLHLDLCPGNILVTRQWQEVFLVRGHPSLPPAQMPSEVVEKEKNGSSIGRPGYVAPKQIDADRFGPVGADTDVYGLGGILYFILYGLTPNHTPSNDPLDMINLVTTRNGPPAPGRLQLASVDNTVARKLEPICLRALDTDRTKRQENVGEFTRDVNTILSAYVY